MAVKEADKKDQLNAAMTDELRKERQEQAKQLLKDLVEAGVHLGHETKDWNPKMVDYIHSQKNGVYIIDLLKTVNNMMLAADYLRKASKMGRNILFVGTSKQASEIIKTEAEKADSYYINERWLGGLLTNFDTIRGRLAKLRELEGQKETGGFEGYGKKEISMMNRQIAKLNKSLGGLKKMRGRPDVVIVVDQKKDKIAITEAKKLGIKVIALTDTNCDPSDIDYVIPANDNSMRSIRVITKFFANAILEGSVGNKKRG